MFTGIVEQLGEVTAVQRYGDDAARFTIRGKVVTADAKHGDSIAVNGVCLTVVDVDGDTFTADVMKETLDRSSLAALAPGDSVNLERAATLTTRMGGHLVQGHVDGTGLIVERVPGDRWEAVRISLAPELNRYVVEKGSITVDGVSLTVTDVDAESFAVSLIPTTLALTTLASRQPGEKVNLEVDVIAKHVEKLLAGGTT